MGMFRRGWWAGLVLLLALAPFGAKAQTSDPPPPPEVKQILDALQSPDVRTWLAAEIARSGDAPPAAAPAQAPPHPGVDLFRARLHDMAAAITRLPTAVAAFGHHMATALSFDGTPALLLMAAAFVAVGVVLGGMVRRYNPRRRGMPPGAGRAAHLRFLLTGWAFDILALAAFALGASGAVLVVKWPPAIDAALIGILVTVVAIRLAGHILDWILAPAHPKLRLVPIDDATARSSYAWLLTAIGIVIAGWSVASIVEALGLDEDVDELLRYAVGVIGALVVIVYAWRIRGALRRKAVGARLPTILAVTLTVMLPLAVLAWIGGAPILTWTIVILTGLPLAILLLRAMAQRLSDPHGADAADPVKVALLQRVVQTVIVIAGALALAEVWAVDLSSSGAQASTAAWLARTVVNVIAAVLVAELLWHAAGLAIDRLVREREAGSEPEAVRQRRRRLRTIMPLVKSIGMGFITIIVALVALSSVGIDIGPLIAGAGVLGLAVGFGAQTLVHDVISGMFYLVDDAFRVGEYISSDKAAGTVESISFRSLRLRHQRGMLHTVPYGTLGTVTNFSRDWVIDKLEFGVTYDSDIALAKKIIKDIGREMAKEPQFAHAILQPLKPQGVDQLGAYAVVIRAKFMAKPGEQFLVRRAAYERVKAAYDAAGIKFAFPTVSVAGGETMPAVAQAALDQVQGAA